MSENGELVILDFDRLAAICEGIAGVLDERKATPPEALAALAMVQDMVQKNHGVFLRGSVTGETADVDPGKISQN
jgi:hypothetical protein